MIRINANLRESLYLVVLAALCFTLQLGSAPLFDGDEGRAAISSWQMWQSGDFLTLYAEGGHIPMPPLPFASPSPVAARQVKPARAKWASPVPWSATTPSTSQPCETVAS